MASSPRVLDVRPRPLALLTGVLGLAAMGVSMWVALTTPLPSAWPEAEPGSGESVACEALPQWIDDTARRGYASQLRVRAEVHVRRRDGQPFLVCGEQRWAFERAGAVDRDAGGVLVRLHPTGRIVTPLPGHRLSPRTQLESKHLMVSLLGILGVFLLALAWAQRPFDPLRDAVGPRAPADALTLSPGSGDRLSWERGAERGELAHASIIDDGQRLIAGPPEPPFISLPGAAEQYRDGPREAPHVHGPALVNGLVVPAGARTPLLDGDHVEITAAGPVVVRFTRVGRVVRYLNRGGQLAFTARFRDVRAYTRLVLAVLVGGAGVLALHVDVPLRGVLGAALLVAFLFVLRRIPARLARPVETRIDLDAVRSGKRPLRVLDEGEAGRAVLDGDAVIGRLPPPATADSPGARGLLLRALDAELALIGASAESPPD